MKLSTIFYALSLSMVETVISHPTAPTPDIQRIDDQTPNLLVRSDDRKCGSHQYSQSAEDDAMGAAIDHVFGNKQVRSKEGNRYPYTFQNKDRDGNAEVKLPGGLCADPDAKLSEWPILRSGSIFGSQGHKRAGDDRVIIATYVPHSDKAPKIWTFCATITHEGASRSGGFKNCV